MRVKEGPDKSCTASYSILSTDVRKLRRALCEQEHEHDQEHEISGGWGGIRTPGAFQHTRFPGVHNQPLCHPSGLSRASARNRNRARFGSITSTIMSTSTIKS